MDDPGVSINGDLESIKVKDLALADIQIANIAPKQPEKFVDPYKYTPESSSSQPDLTEKADDHVISPRSKATSFKYLLGDSHKTDSKGGDAGGLLKKPKFFPVVDFVRSSFTGKVFNSLQHSDVAAPGNSKNMKTYFVTTGFFVAYLNSFDVLVYNLQQPNKETCPQDYSNEYFTKIVVQRKLNASKKKDASLLNFVQQIKCGQAPVDSQKLDSQLSLNLQNQLKELA